MVLTIHEAPQPPPDPDSPELDSIRTEYHPRSKLPPKLERFENYGIKPTKPPCQTHPKPWAPFMSCTDFEFAEIALASALTKDQTDSMIKLITRLVRGQDSFNITSHRDLRETWESASALVTPVAASM